MRGGWITGQSSDPFEGEQRRQRMVDLDTLAASRSLWSVNRSGTGGAPVWSLSGAYEMSNPRPEDYAGLIATVALRQDRVAFAALFRHFAPRVKAWLLRRGVAEGIADELAQETMLTVWRKASRYDAAKAGASTWIFTIARNLCIDSMRHDRHPSELMEAAEAESDDTPRADAMLEAAERDGRLRLALGALSPEQAEVVRLSFFQDKPHAEIEQALGIPLGTVKSRLRLAMNRLRTALEELAP